METHEKIRLMRELHKWSQEDMAEKLEMSAGGYAKIERGETQLSIPRLEQLAVIFKVGIWDLLQSGKGSMVLQILTKETAKGIFHFMHQTILLPK